MQTFAPASPSELATEIEKTGTYSSLRHIAGPEIEIKAFGALKDEEVEVLLPILLPL